MKNIRIIVILHLLVFCTSCTDYLEEENLGGQTADTYFATATGYETLVNSVYSGLRSPFINPSLFVWGTDLFQSIGNGSALDAYNAGLNPQDGTVGNFFAQMYAAIKDANAAIERAADVQDMDAELLSQRVAEVKFLRAWYYFNLVETFGPIPLVTEEYLTDQISCSRAPESAVYDLIIADLQEAVDQLPVEQDNYGRATKGAAQHLLSKVYLTRGYREYSGANDFQNAADLAVSVIESGEYTLLPSFSDVFEEGNEENQEIIFAIQFNTDPIASGDGNNMHTRYAFEYFNFPGLDWTNEYGTPFPGHVPTDFLLNQVFDKYDDSRYDATFRRLWIANADDAPNDLAVGDTAIFFPKKPWPQDKIDAVDYMVVNPDEYDDFLYPAIKKFQDKSAPYLNSSQGRGYRDQFLFRLAETYLLSAEAFFQLGDLTKAAFYINKVRERAAVPGEEASMQIGPDQVTIDFILDERARELAGEMHRWFDLKRTSKLLERAYAYNEQVQSWSTLEEHHLVRPIPENEMNLCPDGSIQQNPEY